MNKSIENIFDQARDDVDDAAKTNGYAGGFATLFTTFTMSMLASHETAFTSSAAAVFIGCYGAFINNLNNQYFHEKQIYDRVKLKIDKFHEKNKNGLLKEQDIPSYRDLYNNIEDDIISNPPKEKLGISIPINKKMANLGIIVATSFFVLSNINSAWEHYQKGHVLESPEVQLNIKKSASLKPNP